MTPTHRTLSAVVVPFAAITLLGSITWGGNDWLTAKSAHDNGSIDSIDVYITDVVSHPCDGGDPVFEAVEATADLAQGYTLSPTTSGTVCRVDLMFDAYPVIDGVVNGQGVIEEPAIDKIIFDTRGSAPLDATIYAGEFGNVSFSLTELGS